MPGQHRDDECTQDERGQSLFVGVMGTPYQSDLVTSLFRLTEESLRQGVEVTVWTCGYGTSLTQSTMVRPADPLLDPRGERTPHPSTAELVQALLERYPRQLCWYVCNYCMEERGAVAQVSEVEIKPAASFNTYLINADKALVIGVKS